jgi:hypothetical protein
LPSTGNDEEAAMATDHGRLDLAGVTDHAVQDTGGVPAEFLAGYLEMLDTVSATGRRLARDELESRRVLGARAAERGVPLRSLVDLYLSANWLAWPDLPAVAAATGKHDISDIAQAILRAADDAVVALADGYDEAQRLTMRREEAERREFIDDLLYGRSDLGRLAERAERFGLILARAHAVAVAQSDEPVVSGFVSPAATPSPRRRRITLSQTEIPPRIGSNRCCSSGSDPAMSS